jgi:hypothetical protein
MRRMPIPLLLLMFVIAFPVAVPIALVLHMRDQRRMQSVAGRTPCERCGATLGVASLRGADAEWKRRATALQHARLMMRLRLIRRVWAICAACGAEYDYDARTQTFHRASDVQPPGSPMGSKGTNTAEKT